MAKKVSMKPKRVASKKPPKPTIEMPMPKMGKGMGMMKGMSDMMKDKNMMKGH